MTKWWFTVALVSTLASVAMAACPNKCSGHGKCGLNDLCDCMQNWVGGDCSGRQCPFTRAWHDTAQRDDDGHYYAECGNRCTCDRTTGECACDAGFVGSGCRRMQCPNDCSGHGTCEFIEELASDYHHRRIGGVAGRKTRSGTRRRSWAAEQPRGQGLLLNNWVRGAADTSQQDSVTCVYNRIVTCRVAVERPHSTQLGADS